MIDKINDIKIRIFHDYDKISTPIELEDFRLKYLVKKGELTLLFDELKLLPNDQKKEIGRELNILKKEVDEKFQSIKDKFENIDDTIKINDLSLPGRSNPSGAKHPIKQTMDEMISILSGMGFAVAECVEIEDEYHNFDALNFAPNHPARDMQDTFFIKSDEKLVLRTHTSPVQIRVMEAMKPPIRSIMPGRVYRNEAVSARSLAEFHQIEGLYIDKNVSLAELKGTMMIFAKKMYGENSKFRFRPSYFPFTEPSAEMDITCFLCGGKGCRICKYQGWLEIAGCGMVHPNVLKSGNIDPDEYSGYAFGFGIERITMLKTGIDDIRLLYDNDVRLLRQF